MLGIAYSAARVHVAPSSDEVAFQAFLREFEQGTTGFINGDASGWKARASRRADTTLMGGWGIVAHGWPEVGSRYDSAAHRFADSGATLKVEYVSSSVSGDLAYTVAIERSAVRLADQPARSPMVLRVTHVFRKEDGQWRLVIRGPANGSLVHN